MRLPILALTLCLTAPVLAPAQAAPGDPIGAAIAIKNDVTAAYETDRRKLAKDDPVRQEEIIEVGEDSLGELKFKDDTKLALGPGSRMTLDKFVYDPEKTNGSIIVNLMKGTFRFITGIAAKPTYQIKTPSASISVRGTIFDVYIKPDGAVWLLLIEGAIEACTDDGNCRILDEPGKFIRIVEDRKAGSPPDAPKKWNVGAPVKWAALPGHKSTPIETAFPFVPSAPSFDPDPWYTTDDIIIGRFPRHPRHPHYPPTHGDGGNTGNNGTKPPTDGKPPVILKDKPPVILKGDKPAKHRPPRDHVNDTPKIKVHKTEEHVRKHTKRDSGNDTPVVKRKSSSTQDKPFRSKSTSNVTPKVSTTKASNVQVHIGGGGGGGNFGHGKR